jgi:hypothetical protein
MRARGNREVRDGEGKGEEEGGRTDNEYMSRIGIEKEDSPTLLAFPFTSLAIICSPAICKLLSILKII